MTTLLSAYGLLNGLRRRRRRGRGDKTGGEKDLFSLPSSPFAAAEMDRGGGGQKKQEWKSAFPQLKTEKECSVLEQKIKQMYFIEAPTF